jgi:hypothetical protein
MGRCSSEVAEVGWTDSGVIFVIELDAPEKERKKKRAAERA